MMRFTAARPFVVGIGLVVATAVAAGREPLQSASAPRVPVIVELFTSEGCSSCPPADDVLTTLLARQPVSGAEIIALGEHVDYWDRLGWRDPFSSADFSARQSDYALKAFHSDTRYTPQMVVDGREHFVGSDYRAATDAVARAARAAKSSLRLAIEAQTAASWNVRLDAPGGVSAAVRADVYVAVVEDGLTTEVRAGENSGRQLRHTAVARSLVHVGTAPKGSGPWSSSASIRIDSGWRRNRLRVVAFAQDHSTRGILAAATTIP